MVGLGEDFPQRKISFCQAVDIFHGGAGPVSIAVYRLVNIIVRSALTREFCVEQKVFSVVKRFIELVHLPRSPADHPGQA